MTPKEAEDIVRKFDEAVVRSGDLDLAMEYAHDDLTVREAPGLPYNEVYTGRQGLTELMEDVGSWWEFLGDLELTYLGVTDTLVVARIEGPARIKATGREVDFLVTEWMTVRDGKVADVEVFYWDQEPLLEAARAQDAVRQANMDLVRRYIDGINAWDFDGMREMLAEDFVFEQMYSPPGMRRLFEGREELLEFQKTFVDTIKTENLHDVWLETLHSDPGEVLAIYRSDMEFADPNMEYRNEYICRFSVRDGKITKFQEYFNPVPLIVSFGGNVESPFETPAEAGG
jgi:uncharacterized protein